MSLQHVSLFAGVGGMDLGMEAAGIPTVAAVELDPAARGVLAHHWPEEALFDDVRKVTGDDLRAAGAVPDRTILSGGFPCTDVSVAGLRAGMAKGSGTRSSLFHEIPRILAEFPARWVVLENVPGVLSSNGGRDFAAVLDALGDCGYPGVVWRVLDSQWFGVPQRRRRVFVVGRAGDTDGRKAVQVLLEPGGSGGDPAPGTTAGEGPAGGAGGGPGGPGVSGQRGFAEYAPGVKTLVATDYKRAEDDLVVNTTGAGWWNYADGASGTLRSNGNNRASTADSLVVVGTLHGTRRGTPNAEEAAGGHLVPWVKAARAQTSDDAKSWREGDVSPTLNVFDNNSESRATVVVAQCHGSNVGGMGTLRSGNGGITGGVPIVTHVAKTAPCLRSGNQYNNSDATMEAQMVVTTAATVRRLTPRECERLQGWPDDHTRWRVDARTGRVVEQSDSTRYRQVGNGVAAPVAEWIARRIVAVEEASA